MKKKQLLGRDFLTLLDFSALEITDLLGLAVKLKKKKFLGKRGKCLAGKNIALLFEKSSTRTRCAFEVAAYDEGANVTCLDNSHFGSKESIADTARVLSRYYDGIQFRGFLHETAEQLAHYSDVPVWNGLTDRYHPTQALADFMTIIEHVDKPLKEVTVAYVGDASNNVAASLMIAAAKLGANFIALAPPQLFPDAGLLDIVRKIAQESGAAISVSSDIAKVSGADVIYTDVWASMGQSDQLAARVALLKPYCVDEALLAATQQTNVIVMHCLPACHDRLTELGAKVYKEHGLSAMEITDDVFQGEHSVVFDQAENRLHTIKALMVATIGR